jgi:hypothetical protein
MFTKATILGFTKVLWLLLLVGTADPALAQAYLDDAQIRKTFAGNTIKFPDFRTKRPVYIFLKEDGGFEMRFWGTSKLGQWWVGDEATFCRQYSDGRRRSCSRVSVKGGMASFHDAGGAKTYEAELLAGNQLP